MNDTNISQNDGMLVCEQSSGELQRARRLQRHAVGTFVQQRIGQYIPGGVSSTLMARDYKSPSDLVVESKPVVYPGVGITSPQNSSNPQLGDPAPTLSTDNRNYLVKGGNEQRKYIVRRLTPIECVRLQGFPDWWFDDVDGSDSAKYKALGNSLAIPCAYDVIKRITDFAESEENDNAL